MNEYFSDEIRAFYCSECKIQKNSKKNLEIHFKRYHAIPNIMLRPDVHDPNLYCSTCEKTSRSKVSFREHMQIVHTLNPDLQYKRLDRSLFPDTKDPDFYCNVCDRKLFNEVRFHKHLLFAHGLSTENSTPIPDLISLENYCTPCKQQFPSPITYMRHLILEHKELNLDPTPPKQTRAAIFVRATEHRKVVIEKIKQSGIGEPRQFGTIFQPGLMPDELAEEPYCVMCRKDCGSFELYSKHLKSAHKEYINYRAVTPDNIPDPRHPHFYCSVCDKRAVNQRSFHFHLRGVHYMEFQS